MPIVEGVLGSDGGHRGGDWRRPVEHAFVEQVFDRTGVRFERMFDSALGIASMASALGKSRAILARAGIGPAPAAPACRASLPRQPRQPPAPACRASRASLPRQPASLSRLGSAGRFLPDHARMPPSAMRCDSAVLTHLAHRGTVGGNVGGNRASLAPRQPASRASLPAWHRASLTAASLTAASLPASPRQPRGVADHR